MRLKCYGKEDITEPVNIPEGKWKEFLQEIIIGTMKNEEHLGSNLKKQCIDYLKDLFNNEVEIIEEDPEDEEIKEHHDIFDYFTGYSFGETNKELLQQLEHNFQIVNEELDYLINKINKD